MPTSTADLKPLATQKSIHNVRKVVGGACLTGYFAGVLRNRLASSQANLAFLPAALLDCAHFATIDALCSKFMSRSMLRTVWEVGQVRTQSSQVRACALLAQQYVESLLCVVYQICCGLEIDWPSCASIELPANKSLYTNVPACCAASQCD